MSVRPQTWVLTGSPENLAATASHGYELVGFKEGRRNQALAMHAGDRIVFYVTRVKAFAASVLLAGELFEDRTKVWPGKPGNPDPYPWRFRSAPEIVLDESDWVPAESLVDELEHIRKWPREHWTLAFQGQLRVLSTGDAALLAQRMHAAAGAAGARG